VLQVEEQSRSGQGCLGTKHSKIAMVVYLNGGKNKHFHLSISAPGGAGSRGAIPLRSGLSAPDSAQILAVHISRARSQCNKFRQVDCLSHSGFRTPVAKSHPFHRPTRTDLLAAHSECISNALSQGNNVRSSAPPVDMDPSAGS
jgi:hypothetical protein